MLAWFMHSTFTFRFVHPFISLSHTQSLPLLFLCISLKFSSHIHTVNLSIYIRYYCCIYGWSECSCCVFDFIYSPFNFINFWYSQIYLYVVYSFGKCKVKLKQVSISFVTFPYTHTWNSTSLILFHFSSI